MTEADVRALVKAKKSTEFAREAGVTVAYANKVMETLDEAGMLGFPAP